MSTQNCNEKATDILSKIGLEVTAAIDPIILLSTRYNTVYMINDLNMVLLKASLCDICKWDCIQE